MKVEKYLSIIRELNAGSVITHKSDEESEIHFGIPDVKLFFSDSKYYFISTMETFKELEDKILENSILNDLSEKLPSNSYFIILSQREVIDVSTYKEIIQFEENEFFYKKYVLYYTSKELKDFEKAWEKLSDKTLDSLLQNKDFLSKKDVRAVDLLYRIIIKTPFLKLNFPKVNIQDFSSVVLNKINSMTKNKAEIIELDKNIKQLANEQSADEIATNMFEQILEQYDFNKNRSLHENSIS